MCKKIIQEDGERIPKMDASIYMTQKDAAAALGVSQPTLRRWNCPRIYIGQESTGKSRRVRYCLDDVRAWLREHRIINH